MCKIPNWIKIVADICGGWMSAMSGGLSVPFALLAIRLGGEASVWFAVLAYAGMWGLAIGLMRKNYAMAAVHTTEVQRLKNRISAIENQIPILEVEAEMSQSSGSQQSKIIADSFGVSEIYEYCIKVTSRRSIAENIEVRLLQIEPNPVELGIGYTDNLEPYAKSARIINPGSHSHFLLFSVGYSDANTLKFARGQFDAKYENPDEQDANKLLLKTYRVKIGVSAIKCEQQIHYFDIHGQALLCFPPFIMTKVTT